jgi:hypothetical protein
MGYLHIDNLYKAQEILLFKECYALEKIHGTSAHVRWKNGDAVHFFSGGTKHAIFVNIFSDEHIAHMKEVFESMGCEKVVVYGESYGGKCQGMSNTYGKQDRFVVFDVCVNDMWLDVPNAEQVAKRLGLDFVPYEKCVTDVDVLTAIRERPSEQAVKCDITEPRRREGIVLRPLIEVTKNNGSRIIAKFKNDEFGETKTPREIDPNKLTILKEAKAIADEWVTEMRLNHVLQKFPSAGIEETGNVIKSMIEDVEREGKDEIVVSYEARKAIGTKTAQMFKKRVQTIQN